MPGLEVAGIEVLVWFGLVRSVSVQLGVSMPLALTGWWAST